MKTQLKIFTNEPNNRVIRISSVDESVNFETTEIKISVCKKNDLDILFSDSLSEAVINQPVKTVVDIVRIPDEINLSEIMVTCDASESEVEKIFAVIAFSKTFDSPHFSKAI